MSIDEDRIISLKYEVAKLQRDYSHLLKQKKDCEENKYKLEQDIENGTSHLERLISDNQGLKYERVDLMNIIRSLREDISKHEDKS